ncbi:16S rRNA (cytosine(1402)-N(4))-methyltransferase RsmH [Desulfonatronovibrio magnus]|uniref:16S rRNA (cytosine(1402)-N(4))-methyltransferase RsmH n=1 Tax=Desulfonatronovibrio magnus TaxID=698827 RepID=UPI000A5AAB41|nr:16S rRNA (cytosine(1402)-N(4))-methyltransferase RsmH [Desulfonatronovibrio magnus]
MSIHKSVMPDQVMHYLQPEKGGRYFDGTLGGGGHSLEIYNACQGDCFILGADHDADAITAAQQRLESYQDRLFIFQGSFENFDSYMLELGWEKLDGVILDLGVSSLQLDTPEKGFSFIKDGPLDMRMGKGSGFEPVSKLLERISQYELRNIIAKYGEEPLAGKIARAIIDAREQKKIQTTLELAEIIEKAYPAKKRAMARNHPATRTFQALRMKVNCELESLEFFLKKIPGYLRPGGRIVVISFHSLEDRLVKHSFKKLAQTCLCPPQYPMCCCGHEKQFEILTKKPVMASDEEVADNPRSRSAKLRAAQRTGYV